MDLQNDLNTFPQRWGYVVKTFSLKYGSEKIEVFNRQIESVETSLSS